MVPLLHLSALLEIVTRRLFSRAGLVLATTAGLVAGVSLVLSIPLYADAVYYRTFRAILGNQETGKAVLNRSPFAFVFQYNGGWNGPRQWEEIQPLDTYLNDSGSLLLGLPERFLVRLARTEPYALFPSGSASYSDSRQILEWTSFGFLTGTADQVQLIEGALPAPASGDPGQPIEVLLSESLAVRLGAQVGDGFVVFVQDTTESGNQVSQQFPVRVSGVWRPADAKSETWPVSPTFLDDFLLVPQETFETRLSPYLPDEVYGMYWYLGVDGSDVRAGRAAGLLNRIRLLQLGVSQRLPDVDLVESPVEALLAYRRSAGVLAILLYTFSIPIIGLILAFIGMVAGLSIESQRNQIAVMRSRGATATQVLLMIGLEGILLGIVALALSSPLAVQIARLIGRTRAFLDFSNPTAPDVSLTASALRAGFMAVGMALVAQVIPAFRAARQTMVSYVQERARGLKRPWWQRAWLDVLLLIPAAYGTYLLKEQGSLVSMDAGRRDPFSDPLLFLVPALSTFSLALLFLRLLPAVMSGVAWLAAHTRSVGMLQAARQLSRHPQAYNTPLIILILTLSLSAYTASLSQTLDRHLYDQVFYQVGADMKFTELGEAQSSGPGRPDGGQEAISQVRWLFLPVSEYLKADGIQAAVRVGKYAAAPDLASGTQVRGTFLGVDRLDFPQVAFWRRDFAGESLGWLMNQLAFYPNGVLVSSSFLKQNRLQYGEALPLAVDTYGVRSRLTLKIVGSFDLFPTWYPVEGPLFVGNLDYLFEHVGSQFPYQVWVDAVPGADLHKIGEKGLLDLNVRVLDWEAALLEIHAEQSRPERQGLFGLLFIGFASAALLTVLGFLLYILFSIRRRMIEFGVLRAAGLKQGQMISCLGWELFFLVVSGGVAGTGLGALVSSVYIPYLQIGLDAQSRVPPFQVSIAWPAIFQVYTLFGTLFLVTLVSLVVIIRRMKIFQAIKLGETI